MRHRFALAALFLILVAPTGFADEARFVDIGPRVMPAADVPRTKRVFTVQLADFNGDGRIDILSGGHGRAEDRHIYLQSADGTFVYLDNGTYQTPSTGSSDDVNRITSSDTVFDIDGDGCLDITGWDADGGHAGYIACDEVVDGKVRFRPRVALNNHWTDRAVFWDYDGDTEIESLSVDGKNKACDQSGVVLGRSRRANAEPFFSSREVRIADVGCLGQESFGIVDINNDGWPEAFHSGTTRGKNARRPSFVVDNNNGELRVREAGIPSFRRGSRRWLTGDFDSDGDQDLLLHAGGYHKSGGNQTFLLRNEGDGTFVDVTAGSGIEGQAQTGQALKSKAYWTTYSNSRLIDYDLDSRPDVFFAAESYSRAFVIFRNVTTPGSDQIRFEIQRPRWPRGSYEGNVGKQFVAVGDIDSDGLIDALTPHTKDLAVYRNTTRDAESRHWLRVRLVGPGRNTHAAHASVIARAPGSETIITSYQITPSFSSFLVPHLGLGDYDRVDLEIIWPGHNKFCPSEDPCRSEFADLSVDRLITIDWESRQAIR